MQEKKTAFITGGNRGIGLACSKVLMSLGFETHSFSRANGFDLQTQNSRTELMRCVTDLRPDIFVNNAPVGFHQSELLFEVFKIFKTSTTTKRIINIGSQAAVDYQQRPSQPLIYDYQKLSLQKMSLLLSSSNRVLINHIDIGYTKTDRTQHLKILEDGHLNTSDIETTLHWILTQPPHMTIPYIFVRPITTTEISVTL